MDGRKGRLVQGSGAGTEAGRQGGREGSLEGGMEAGREEGTASASERERARERARAGLGPLGKGIGNVDEAAAVVDEEDGHALDVVSEGRRE
jgi:hypothetical protein